MSPEMIYTLVGLGASILGGLVHRYAIAPTNPPAPSPGTPVPAAQPAPAIPGRISIGHGELLSLLLTAFNSQPPSPGPQVPLVPPALPQPGPPPAPIDLNALVQQLLAMAKAQPQVPLAAVAPSPTAAGS